MLGFSLITRISEFGENSLLPNESLEDLLKLESYFEQEADGKHFNLKYFPVRGVFMCILKKLNMNEC